MNEIDKLRIEYDEEYPLIMGFREIDFESWLAKELIDSRERVKNHVDLGSIRQQRELLNAFAGKWNAANIDWENIEIYDNEIEDFIKGIL